MENDANTLISVIVPAYNEQEVLHEFHQRLSSVLATLPLQYEILYVNDGSSDSTAAIIQQLHNDDPHVTLLDLSRNFGKEIAMSAGLQRTEGDVMIIIDADLQDPPELIPQLVDEWRAGWDVVYAKRSSRNGESWLKKVTAHLFYRVMQQVGEVRMPSDAGDFRLLSRRAVDALNGMPERHRFMKGMFAWIGFKQKAVHYQRDARFAGASKWNYWRLWNFAIEGITSYTTAPLKLASYIGTLSAIGAFIYGIYMLIDTLIHGNPVAGYPSLVVIILFLGGVQLISIGMLGEYIGRIFTETKNRPLYLVNQYLPSRARNHTSDG